MVKLKKESPKEKAKEKEETTPAEVIHEKVLFINRCSKVVKGGRRFSFSALVVVGDEKGRVGYGFGKANEVTDAIKKAVDEGRKRLVKFAITDHSIPHDVEGVHDGVRVIIKRAKEGTGVVAGSCVRAVLEMAKIPNVVAKNIGRRNTANNQVIATMKALQQLQPSSKILEKRGV